MNERRYLLGLLEPLDERLAQINARLDELQTEAALLRSERADIEVVVKRLDPSRRQRAGATSAATRNGNAARQAQLHEQRVAAIREYVRRHPERVAEGFTRTSILAAIKAEGGIAMTPETAGRAIDELREQGIIRADKRVKGGGMQYKVVARG